MTCTIESEAVRAAVDRVCGPWDRGDGPGLAIGVMIGERVLLRRGYGLADVGTGRPNGPAVPMRIASLSKQFLTTLVLLLEAEGRLSIEDDVRAYLPFLPDQGMRVSLAQMLSHQSGLRDFLELRLLSGGGFDEPGPPEESIALAGAPTGLNFSPGNRFAYSNTGFLLLTLIVEQLTGQPLEAVLEERIFRPLGMRSTKLVRTDESPIRGRALPYVETAAGLYPGRWGVTIGGEGGLVSTVDDLLIWAHNLRRPTVGDSSLFARMSAPRPYAAGGSSIYGLGLTVMDYRDTRTYGHHGQLPGLFAEFAVFPDLDATIVLLANTSNLNPFALGRALADALFDRRLAARPPVDLPVPAPQLAGRYHNSHDDMVLDLAVSASGDLRIGTAMVNVPAEWHLPGRFRPIWPMNHLELSITPDGGGPCRPCMRATGALLPAGVLDGICRRSRVRRRPISPNRASHGLDDRTGRRQPRLGDRGTARPEGLHARPVGARLVRSTHGRRAGWTISSLAQADQGGHRAGTLAQHRSNTSVTGDWGPLSRTDRPEDTRRPARGRRDPGD